MARITGPGLDPDLTDPEVCVEFQIVLLISRTGVI